MIHDLTQWPHALVEPICTTCSRTVLSQQFYQSVRKCTTCVRIDIEETHHALERKENGHAKESTDSPAALNG